MFDLEDKPWGPHYFRIGLDLATDFRGGSGFNVKISHNRHWLDANGSEWRNQLQIGEVPRWYTEIYHPLNWTLGLSNDWFVSALRRGAAPRHHISLRQRQRRRRQPVQPPSGTLGIDLGQPWAELGELRMGLTLRLERTTPEVVTTALSAATARARCARPACASPPWSTSSTSPTSRRAATASMQKRSAGGAAAARAMRARTSRAWRAKARWCAAGATRSTSTRAQRTPQDSLSALGRYTLGGFHQLSGYRSGQLDGNSVVFTRLTSVPPFADGAGVHARLLRRRHAGGRQRLGALERGAHANCAAA